MEGIPIIRTLATLCPLLGLLGTVTGMILVFDMMGALGTSSARVVASGVSTAMVTTMAGMVGALTGIFPAAILARRARARLHALQIADDGSVAAMSSPPPGGARRRLRHIMAPVGAIAMTLGLMLFMETIIVTGRAALSESTRMFPIEFVRVARETEVQQRERRAERPDAPLEAPELPSPPMTADNLSNPEGLAVAPPRAELALTRIAQTAGGPIVAGDDGDYLPVVKVAPVYPRIAEVRGLEGWVLVRFTVTSTGSVRNIEVVESSHELFEDAAITAASKFKYRPRIIDGQPIEVRGVLNRITFTLERQG